MERILTYTISSLEENLTISEFLKRKGFSSQNIIELKKMERSVLIHNEWMHMNYRLQVNQELVIHIQENNSNEHIVPIALPFPIVYEDEDIVVINKPANMPIHPSQNNYENTLANAAAYYYEIRQNTPFTFRCINRLDRDTTGLTILAKNMYSANILASYMQERKIKRLYVAILDGSLEKKWGTLNRPIGRKDNSTIEREINYEQGEKAITHYYRIEQFGNYQLAAFQLETGRTHQIRVHMSSINAPLVGDTLYNTKPSATLMNRQALHAYRISFPHPISGKTMKFVAPVPEDMTSFLDSFAK